MVKLKKIKRQTIATRLLLWFLVIAVLPLVIAIYLTFATSESSLRKEINSNLLAIADSKARQIETYALERKRNVSALAHLPNVVSSIDELNEAYRKRGINTAEYQAAADKVGPFFSYYIQEFGYSNVFLVTVAGDALFSAKPGVAGLGANYYDEPYRSSQLGQAFDRAKTLKETQISDFDYFASTGQPAAFVAAPIFNGNSVIGAVVLQLSNQEVYKVVNDYSGLGETGETVVGHLTGQEVLFVTPTRHDLQAAFQRKVRLGSQEATLLEKAVQGSQGQAVGTDYRGQEVVAVWRYLPAFQWGMVVKIDSAEAFASINNQRTTVMILGAVMLVVVTLVALLVARTISEPLIRLTRSARLIAGGDLNQRVAVKGNDEVGELTEAFNRMTSDLKHSYESIEETVRQRTLELQQTNIELDRERQASEASNRAKSTFLANMSHELRTPLNAIMGYSEMLQEEAAEMGQENILPDLQKIHGAGKHLLNLINDVLDLSKIEAGRMELYLETFEVRAMIRDVVMTIQPLIKKNKNSLILDCPDDLGLMEADLTKVRQALFNLLSNASKFTENGTITLQVARENLNPNPKSSEQSSQIETQSSVRPSPNGGSPQSFIFRVTDTGIGMSQEQATRLFQPFIQADVSTTRKYGGTGLGLTISQKFCVMMGGSIEVSSRPGQGSTFTIKLPARVRQVKADLIDVSVSNPELASPTIGTVLVIDDDPVVCDLIKRFLEKEGFRVENAASGEEGLRLARQLKPIAITLDVMMPGHDGWDVLTRLKNDPELADIPVIMLTIVDDRNLGFALGANDYLTKPIHRDRLIAVLNKYRKDHTHYSVLVVEDDPLSRSMMLRMLEREGWSVEEAENGRVALQRVAESKPELILLDLMMPEVDGFQFVAELRKQEEWRSIPIVVITAKDITIEDGLRLNGYVERVIQKGQYSRDVLLRQVRDLVGGMRDEG